MLPTQVPFEHVSVRVQPLLSVQVPPLSGVTVHELVPLQARVLQGSLVHVMAVPTHWADPLHVSVCVQRFPSLQLPLVRGADAQVGVPLHDSVVHEFGLLVQVMAVPTH